MTWYRASGGGIPQAVKDMKTVSTASGSMLSFNTDLTDNIIDCTVTIPADVTGVTSLSVTRCSVNIWNEEWVRGYYSASTGALVETAATTLACKYHLKVYPGLSIRFICPSSVNFGIFRYDITGTYINRITGVTSGTVITIPDDVYEIAFQIPNYGANTSYTYQYDVSLNVPDTVTTYNTYSGNTYNVSLGETLTQGGTFNFITGVLVRTDTTSKQLDSNIITTLSGHNLIYPDIGNLSVTYLETVGHKIS